MASTVLNPFLDDIIVFGHTKTEHDKRLVQVRQRLHDYTVLINDKKSSFCVLTVDNVRHNVFSAGFQPLKLNIDEIVKL